VLPNANNTSFEFLYKDQTAVGLKLCGRSIHRWALLFKHRQPFKTHCQKLSVIQKRGKL